MTNLIITHILKKLSKNKKKNPVFAHHISLSTIFVRKKAQYVDLLAYILQGILGLSGFPGDTFRP